MTTTKRREPVMVQLFDRAVVREYERDHHGLIFSSTEVVKADILSEELILTIQAPHMPNRILFNGEEVTLTKVAALTTTP